MIEKYLGCKSDAFSENDFVRLKKVYRTLRDGNGKERRLLRDWITGNR